MDARLQRRVQRYGWDRAEVYEAGWRAQLAPAHDLLLSCAALAPGEAVLDVACGTGLASFPAARLVAPGGRVVGVDLSERMVERARERAASLGVDNFEARCMDAERLELDDERFDVVLHALGLMYVPDPAAALRETRRVLRPGGRAVVAVWGDRRSCGWAPVFPIVQRQVRSEVCPLFFRLGGGEVLADTLRRGGFEQVGSHRIETTLRYASPAAAVAAVFEAGPVALAWSRFDAETRRRVEAEYLAAIAAYASGAGYAIPGEFVVAHGQRPA